MTHHETTFEFVKENYTSPEDRFVTVCKNRSSAIICKLAGLMMRAYTNCIS